MNISLTRLDNGNVKITDDISSVTYTNPQEVRIVNKLNKVRIVANGHSDRILSKDVSITINGTPRTWDPVTGPADIQAALETEVFFLEPVSSGDAFVWGLGTGNIADQTDLQNALTNAKARANHTGTQLASTISDFQTQVSANTDVAAMKLIIGTGISDGDTVVNTLSEMLSVFQTYTEGADIATILASKANLALPQFTNQVGIGVAPGTARLTLPGVTNTIADGIDFGSGIGLFKTSSTSVGLSANIDFAARYLYVTGMSNTTSSTNALITVPSTGTVIANNKTGTDSTLTVNMIHASGTGKILDMQFGGVSRGSIDYSGMMLLSTNVATAPASGGQLLRLHAATGTVTAPVFTVHSNVGSSGAEKVRIQADGSIGLLTSAATHTMTHASTSTGEVFYNTSDQVTNTEYGRIFWTSNIFTVTTANAGTGTNRLLTLSGGGRNLTIGNVGYTGIFNFGYSTTAADIAAITVNGTHSNASGTAIIFNGAPTFNQSSTAAYKIYYASPLETALGSATKLLMDLGTNSAVNGATATHTSKFSVDNTGALLVAGTAAFSSTVTVTGSFGTSGTLSSANFASYGNTFTGISLTELSIGGGSSTYYRISERGNGVAAPVADMSFFSHIIGTQVMVEAGSGNHPIVGQLALKGLSVTPGAGGTTNAATLYIENAMTGVTPTGANYALWVAAGDVRFGGAVRISTGVGVLKSDASGNVTSGSIAETDVTNLVADLGLKQDHLATKSIGFYLPNGSGAVTFAVGGMVTTPVGGSSATARTPATTNMFTMGRRLGQTSAASAGSCAGLRSSSLSYWRGNAAGLGGFLYKARFGMADAATVSGRKAFIGFYANTNNATSDPSALVNTIFMAFDPAMTNWRIMSNNGTTTTQVDLGANFPCNTDSTDIYDLTLYAVPNGTGVDYTVVRVNTGDIATGTVAAANLPASTTLLGEHLQTCNGATALSVTVDIWWKYIETVN